MALIYLVLVLPSLAVSSPSLREKRELVTCPGFAGYCSESYPGQTCLVVCAFGRNNVPLCQDDGTWTDIPRCIEHEPGQEQQVPGLCPGIPGYCSLDNPGGLCEFDCLTGPDIRSSCTSEGTWEPYPRCDGDIRETRDGCDGCPGPFGGPRNRTAEAGGGRRGGGGRKAPTGGTRAASGGKRNGGKRNGGGKKNGGGRKAAPSRNTPRSQSGRPSKAKPKAQPRRQNGGGRRSGGGGNGGSKNSLGGGSCPGELLQSCIDVCPGFSARVFGACVAGCAKRCPNRK